MDARERWQALQAHLSAARTFAQAGDHQRAVAEVERALAVDPDFLAAHSLREQLNGASRPATGRPDVPPSSPPAPSPVIQLEARARARRAERRLTAACDALASGHYKAAGIALDEARELGADPGDVLRVEQALAARRAGRHFRPRRGRARRVGPWLAAAATVAAGVLGASYLGERNEIPSRAFDSAEPVAPSTGSPVSSIGEGSGLAAPAGATSTSASASVAVRQDLTRASVIVTPVASLGPTALPAPTPADVREPFPQMPPVKSAVAPIDPAAPAPAAAPAVASSTSIDPRSLPPPQAIAAPKPDDAGVRDVLQRYRTAYEDLNARSARAVWPAVDERALARAFDGLSSQRLNFDNCNVALHGDAATATCKGTTRFVPKVGSREALVEPRTWQFTLKKGDAGWAIETARTDR